MNCDKKQSDELLELAEFACMLMDDPTYYCNEDKLLADFREYKQKQKEKEEGQEM